MWTDKWRLALCIGALTAFLLPASALAQTESGKIVGTVVDQSGGVLPGATVAIKSEAGASRSTVTDAGGRFTFANLQPSAYTLTVELTGFRTKQIKTQVTVGATVEVSAHLEVGAQSEVITVVGVEETRINTTTQDIAVTVNEKQIRDLPTLTRNAYDLVALAGNVSNAGRADSGENRGAGFNINGQRQASTNILLDGGANNDEFTSSVGQQVPLDSVQEFSVITSNFSAQFGRASGGIVNVATKSGTNEYRGTAYEFFRNAGLATNTFDNKARGNPKGDFTRHQAGFSLGGPIQKDKLHFFLSGEYIRVRSAFPQISWVPTPELLAASAAATQSFFKGFPLAIPINGPILTAGQITGVNAGGPFAKLGAGFPAFGQVTRSVPDDAGGGLPRNDYQGVARLDWNIGPNTQFYVRYAIQHRDFLEGSNSNSPYAGFDTGELNRNHNLLGSLTHVFSSHLTSQTKIVYNYLKDEQPLGAQPVVPTLFMRTIAQRINGIRVALPGYLPFSPGNGIPFGGPQKLLQFYQDLTYVTRNHDLRFGGSYVRIMDDRVFGAYQEANETLGSTLGNALDNLVRGQLLQFQTAVYPQGKFPGQTLTLPVGPPQFGRSNRYNEFAAYFNDTWSVTSRLKLNLGARYEYYGVQHNTDPSLDSNFYYGSGDTIFQQIRNGQVFTTPQSPIGALWAPDKNNLAPRVGFAWDVTGDGKTSLRAGYGIAYERNFGNVTFNVIQNPPNYAVVSITAPGDVPVIAITANNAGPLVGTGTKVLPRTSLRHVREDIVNAYAHFWSVSLQRELFKSTFGSVEYTGSAGRDLYSIENSNRAGTGAVYLGDANTSNRLNAQYSNINTRGNNGKSSYNAVTASLDTRDVGGSGLTMTARYTWSKAKDNLSNTFSEGNNVFNLGMTDPFNPELDYGYADFDIRHRVAVGALWEIPLAKNSSGLAKALLNGWQLNFILTAQSGNPFTVFDCSNAITTCARLAQVATVAGYTEAQGTDPNTFNYLDLGNQAGGVGSIANPKTGTTDVWQGTNVSNMAARNSFRRPGRYNIDAAVFKRFHFTDRVALQLRLEAYNLLNHANLNIDGSTADTSSQTLITAFKGFTDASGFVGDGQRRLQIAAKIEF
jgi:outer membrane receptor protein involved in Fe transport